jgi:hypothetical protein
MMKTGFGESTGDFENQMMQSAIGIIQPVLEMGMVLAGKYAHACGRDTILSKDVEYAMKYCVMHTVGQKIGTHFPDLYDEEDTDSDEDDIEVVEESDEMFERYSGEDETFLRINEAYDTWDQWSPTNPTEEMLKNAINSNGLI